MLEPGCETAAVIYGKPQPRLQGLYAIKGYEDRDGDGQRIRHAAALDHAEYQTFEQMIEMGMGELDNSAVLGVIERLAGANLYDEE